MQSIPASSALFQRVEASFLRQGMMRHLGARLGDVAPGLCEVFLPYSDRVTQQQGEPPRVLWRLKSLRGLSHEVEQVFP